MFAHFCWKVHFSFEILGVLQFVFRAKWIIAWHNHLTCSRDLSFSPLTAIFHVLNHSSSNQFNLRETMCSGVPNRHFAANSMRNGLHWGMAKKKKKQKRKRFDLFHLPSGPLIGCDPPVGSTGVVGIFRPVNDALAGKRWIIFKEKLPCGYEQLWQYWFWGTWTWAKKKKKVNI